MKCEEINENCKGWLWEGKKTVLRARIKWEIAIKII